MEKQIINLTITNPDKDWVVKELDKLIVEWEVWQKEVAQIRDHPYNQNTETEVFADGEENMQKHEILQGKTLTFLNNNIRGHGFIIGFDGERCDRTNLRLSYRVKHRLHQLKILQASLQYPKSVACEEHNSKQNRKETASELPFPEKVTLIWLFQNVPVRYWISFFGLLLALLFIGIQASRLSFVQEIFNLHNQTLQNSSVIPNQAESTNIFAEVSKDGKILRSNNFEWKIKKSNDRDGNILYTIVDRRGDASAVSVIPDTPKYTVYQSYDGMVIKYTCAEEEISNFTIKVKY